MSRLLPVILGLLLSIAATDLFASQSILLEPGATATIYPGQVTTVTCSGSGGNLYVIDSYCQCAAWSQSNGSSGKLWSLTKHLIMSNGTEKKISVANSSRDDYFSSISAAEASCQRILESSGACRNR